MKNMKFEQEGRQHPAPSTSHFQMIFFVEGVMRRRNDGGFVGYCWLRVFEGGVAYHLQDGGLDNFEHEEQLADGVNCEPESSIAEAVVIFSLQSQMTHCLSSVYADQETFF